jgi:hypothetical protein
MYPAMSMGVRKIQAIINRNFYKDIIGIDGNFFLLLMEHEVIKPFQVYTLKPAFTKAISMLHRTPTSSTFY